jgi:hypothetical protein
MPAPRVSILTAVAERPGHRLVEIHTALAAAPPNWEWLIQPNGRSFTYHHHAEQVTASREWQAQFDRDMRCLTARHRALQATRTPAS